MNTTRLQKCDRCGMVSPPTETNYTLISPKHAWRMVVLDGPDGKKTPVWYCPKCWDKRKTILTPR